MKRILAILLLLPCMLLAMDETPEKDDLYVGIIAQILNRLERNKRVDIYPTARTTLLYRLPYDRAEKTTFEYVDTIEDLNPPVPNNQIINIYSDYKPLTPQLKDIGFLKDLTHGVATHKLKITYGLDKERFYSPQEIPLGNVCIYISGKPWGKSRASTWELKPAHFGPAHAPQFLPGSTFDQGDNVFESTVPKESLTKCPAGNCSAFTIAFLKMVQQYDDKKQQIVYVPEGTQNKDHTE